MTTKNDDNVLLLQEKIQNKEESLKKLSTSFAPKTNLIFGKRNLNVAKEADLLEITRDLIMAQKVDEEIKSKDFGFNEEYFKIHGYSIDDWLHDVRKKMESIRIMEEKQKLSKLKAELKDYLSDEKRIELELDRISRLI